MDRIAVGTEPVEVTRLVLGTAWFTTARRAEVEPLLDAWATDGGNAVDTARHYSDGESEREIGRWLADGGGREALVVIGKGGHPDSDGRSRLAADQVRSDLLGSLDRLGVPAIDVYLLHRDDPSVPAGRLVDILEEHRLAGRIRAYGGSNWTTARLAEAAAHARAYGAAGFALSSPHLSLARWSEEPWPGTVAATDAVSRAWYAREGLPVLAWSAQASGWFAGPGRSEDPLAVAGRRVLDTPANEERLRRAEIIARELGAFAAQVALAWVLRQPFPIAAVIGPRTVTELRESVAALDIALSEDDRRWLDLETDDRVAR